VQQGTMGSMADGMRAVIETSTVSANWTAAYGLALFGRGELAQAEEILESFTLPPQDYLWLGTLQAVSELAVSLGNRPWCELLSDRLWPFRQQLGVVSQGSLCFALVSTTLGDLFVALGRHDDARPLLEESVVKADSMGAAFERCKSRRLLAQVLAETTGSAAEITRLLDEATALAARHGFTTELRHLDLLSGSTPRLHHP
jgi:hypothetical protein